MPILMLDSDRDLRGLPVAILDFETTGLVPGQRHPVQIAVECGRLGLAVDEAWSTLVKPPIPIPADSSAIHGIMDADVADAPDLAAVLGDVISRLDGRALCAYNLPFDHAVLVEAFEHLGLPGAPPLVGLDPLVWVKLVDKYERGKRLEDAATRRGLSFASHDARADVAVTGKLMPTLLRQLAVDGHVGPPVLDRADAFWQWQRDTALAQERDYRDYRLRVGRDAPTMSWHTGLGVAAD